MNYNITHRTLYDYAAPVSVSHHVARLEPRVTAIQSRESFTMRIFPEPTLRRTRADFFGNQLCVFSVQEVHGKLEIITSSRVTVRAEKSTQPESAATWESVAEMFRDPVSPEVVEPYQFVFDSPLVRASQELFDYARESFAADTPLLVGARDLTRRLHQDFKFDTRATTVATPLEGSLGKTARRLPGLCPSGAGLPAFAGVALPLCERLPAHPPAGG